MGVLQKLHQHSDRYFRMQVLLAHGGATRERGASRHRRGRGEQGRDERVAAHARAHPRRRPVASCPSAGAARRGAALPVPSVATVHRARQDYRASSEVRGTSSQTDDAGSTTSIRPTQQDVVAHVPHGTADDVRAAVGRGESRAAGVARAHRARRAPSISTNGPAAIADRAASDWRSRWRAKSASRSAKRAARSARCVAILRYYAGEAVRAIGEVIPGAGRRRAAVHAARAARRRRAHHAVEFSARDSAVEGRARARVRQHRRAQAGRERRRRWRVLLAETAAAAGTAGRRVQRGARRRADRRRGAASRAPEVRAVSFTGSGRGRRARSRRSPPRATSATRRRWAARTSRSSCPTRTSAGRGAHRRRRDALRRAEVHGDEPRRRRARGRETSSSTELRAQVDGAAARPGDGSRASAVGPVISAHVARLDSRRARATWTPRRCTSAACRRRRRLREWLLPRADGRARRRRRFGARAARAVRPGARDVRAPTISTTRSSSRTTRRTG